MDTLEAYKAAALDIIRQHLLEYSERIAACETTLNELMVDGNWHNEQELNGLLESREVAQCKRVALLSLKRDLEAQHLI